LGSAPEIVDPTNGASIEMTSTGNSTLNIQPADFSILSSPNVSPIETNRSNGMFESSTSFSDALDAVKANYDKIDFGNVSTTKALFVFLFDKFRLMENLLIETCEENKTLHEKFNSLDEKIGALAIPNMNDIPPSAAIETEKTEGLSDKVATLATIVENLNNIHVQDSETAKSIDQRNLEKFQTMNNKINTLYSKIEEVESSIVEVPIVPPTTDSVPQEDHLTVPQLSPPGDDLLSKIQQCQIETSRLRIEFEQEKDESISRQAETSDRFYKVESGLLKSSQYTRRQNLVIDGIPDSVPQDRLEGVCIDIVNRMGGNFNVTPKDVEGVHRLYKSDPKVPAPTIIRFTNRKIKEFCIRFRWRLPKIGYTWKLSMRENLEDMNEKVFNVCEDMKKRNVINKFVINNGFIKIFETARSRPVKIHHPDDLKTFFPDFFNVFPDYSEYD
jgi:hypothetical protein